MYRLLCMLVTTQARDLSNSDRKSGTVDALQEMISFSVISASVNLWWHISQRALSDATLNKQTKIILLQKWVSVVNYNASDIEKRYLASDWPRGNRESWVEAIWLCCWQDERSPGYVVLSAKDKITNTSRYVQLKVKLSHLPNEDHVRHVKVRHGFAINFYIKQSVKFRILYIGSVNSSFALYSFFRRSILTNMYQLRECQRRRK